MSEVKTVPIELKERVPYIPGPGEVVFTDDHSIADIVRYAVKCGDQDEVQYCLDTMDEED